MKKNRRSGSKNNLAALTQSVKTLPETAAPAAPEAAVTEEMILQFGEKEVTVAAISEKARQDYKNSGSEAVLKDIKIYVKPEGILCRKWRNRRKRRSCMILGLYHRKF